MPMNSDSLVRAWINLQARHRILRPPVTEGDYLKLIALLEEVTTHYDCNREPHASLFDLLASYADRWEREHGPDLKNLNT